MLKWLALFYQALGANHPRLSLAIAVLLGGIVFGLSWWAMGKQYQKQNPELFRRNVPSQLTLTYDAEFERSARVFVRNDGKSEEFTANAKILDIKEPGNNKRNLTTFNPPWLESGKSFVSIPSGTTQTLQLARADRGVNNLCEIWIQESTSSGPKDGEWFAWYFMKEVPVITVEITITAPDRQQHKETVIIQGGKNCGVRVTQR